MNRKGRIPGSERKKLGYILINYKFQRGNLRQAWILSGNNCRLFFFFFTKRCCVTRVKLDELCQISSDETSYTRCFTNQNSLVEKWEREKKKKEEKTLISASAVAHRLWKPTWETICLSLENRASASPFNRKKCVPRVIGHNRN